MNDRRATTHSIRLRTPDGVRESGLGRPPVSVTDRYVAVDGEPVFPVTGEVHYSRVPSAHWERTLRGLRASGATHVATYVLWNHHEPVRGTVSFEGDLDLRRFLQIAREVGLGIVLRIGPYAHAESRHGGLPDWVAEGDFIVRSDDPAYLAEAERWYRQIAAQADGIELFAVQVDNELYDRPEHLRTLRGIATSVGIDAPLWVATGWGGAELPDDVLPVFGGYSDSFWVAADLERDERSLSNFQISERRDDDSIGVDHRVSETAAARDYDLPFATCELGSGMVAAYHRRPVVRAADVDALGLAKLASGSVWQGYYMFSDGRNPAPGLQESQATGAPNDFLDLSYDFGGPLAVDGSPRDSWFRLRRQHHLLAGWGAALAAMPATLPEDAPDHPDTERLRWSVRTDGHSGFLFVVNHQPHTEMPDHDDVVFTLERDGTDAVTFPTVDVPAGAAFAWPFGLRVGDAEITWATAQPLAIVAWRDAPLLVLTETAGIPAAFATDDDVSSIDADGPGTWHELSRAGTVLARVLVLPEDEGLRFALDTDGTPVLAAGVVANGVVELWRDDTVAPLSASGWQTLGEPAAPSEVTVLTREISPRGTAPVGTTADNGRASVPTDFSSAARVELSLPDAPDATLVITWEGDVARLFDGDRLVSDALYRGQPWRISAAELQDARHLSIDILPLHPDAPVYIGAERPLGARVLRAELVAPARVALPR